MYLKSLEISGFKSFGKKVNLEFNAPISAIVGPNGSGKSNVAESFRFVLGEQSIKSMRGKRGEDLIFNGSDAGLQSLSRLNRASVKVVFDNSRKVLPVDFEEVSIERVVHRDGVNEYFINGSQVRLKDVQELLSHAHIGSSGHHIISQGEADRILSANPKERRAMLEDALGLKIFQYKKTESERKLKSTEENMKQVESLRRELAPHLKFLKKQVEKIEKAEGLKVELEAMYKEYLKREELYLEKAKENIIKDLEVPERELSDLVQKLEEIKNTLAKENGGGENKLKLIETENNLRHNTNEQQKLNHAIGRIEGEIASIHRMEERSKSMEKERGSSVVPVREIENLIEEVQNEFAKAETAESFDLVKSILGKAREIFRNFVEKYRGEVGEKVDNHYVEEITKLEEEKSKVAAELSKMENSEKVLVDEIKNINNLIETEAQGNREAEREMFTLLGRQNELQNKISILKNKRNQLELEEDDFKRELGEAGAIIGRSVSEYSSVEVEFNPFEDRTVQHERRRHVEKLKIRLEELGLGSTIEVMNEYKETEERDAFLAKEIEDLQKSGNDLQILIKELENRIDTEFKDGIHKINFEFQKYFELLFGGGKAGLMLVKEEKKKKDTDIIFDENEISDISTDEENQQIGIDIHVDLPKKKVKALMMLSGGERALTSIALLFAMSQVNPPPFIILDETDAALDEANSKKYGDMIENLANYSQLIVITHNRETMSRAGVLYGVTMMSGLSKLLSIKFDEAVAVAK